ncbi:MAG: SpoIIE family protein phosphatase [Firmicutes bacterium]|nr:SpoIIE family protein phosphatase [Bacillota bacterium]
MPARPEGLFIEIGKSQLNKAGEELCGDSIDISHTADSTIVIVSDGLGSGVKANILSSLTTRIASTMLKSGCKIDEVIGTLASTLPVCKVRHLAYSTFSILQIFKDGRAYLAEYDNPAVFAGGKNGSPPLSFNERKVGERSIRETYFTVDDGDWLCLVSDGVLHAGIGGIWNLGWGWDRVGAYVQQLATKDLPAEEFAAEITALCKKLYGGKPGDDASAVVVRIRAPRTVTVLVGPPREPADDPKVVAKLARAPGKKVVCGGTTGNMVARVLGKKIEVDLGCADGEVPPIGVIEGIDLVTEGMLTLVRVLNNLKEGVPLSRMFFNTDGASILTVTLLQSDRVHFIVGRAINPAHQSPGVPPLLALKPQIIDDIVRHLRRLGKRVTVEYH